MPKKTTQLISPAPQSEQPLWSPSSEFIATTAMFRFMQKVVQQYGIDATYDSLHHWSITQREQFWAAVWEFTDIQCSRRWDTVVENGDAMPGASWFNGSRLNFAENLLRYRDEHPAIIFRGESKQTTGRKQTKGSKPTQTSRTLTYQQLYAEVARVSEWLTSLGVKTGDRVAGYMSNGPEAIIAMLAATSIGAIWSSCSPDFGVKGVVERFAQIKPKVLFAIDGYRYNGKQFDLLESIATVADELPSIQHVIMVPFLHAPSDSSARASLPKLPKLPKSLSRKVLYFDDYAAATAQAEIEFAQLPFDHPLYILYSSGTTGAPKCIVHSAGGTLIQHLKEHQLHVNIGREDRFFYFTTCGWMMWNWLVSGLASGCTLVLYDGSPFFPNEQNLWQLAEELRISVFGVSARYIAAQDKAGIHPGEKYDLTALKTILSTGSPLAPQNFEYVYQHVKSNLVLASMSGGTDIVSCFVLGNPILPVYRGEIQCRGLGMAVEVYADEAAPVVEQQGELVCTKPFPSMPLGFWSEHDHGYDQERYRAAYFERFKDIWTQGDYAEITKHGGMVIYGRSDAVLNPGGVRIGTAEIYRQVEKVDEVLESLCIGQRWEDDVRVVLFVMLREGVQLTDDLATHIRTTIQNNATRRHVPKKIIAVPDIPRTLSGKIVELAVKKIVHEESVTNTKALANPEALDYFRDLPELKKE